jgi:hypothetical protein
MTKSVQDIVFDLEHPIFEARSLAHVLTMMSTSDELRGESGQAVAVVANSLLGYLETIKGAKHSWRQPSRRPRNDVSGAVIGNSGGRPLDSCVGREQALNVGKPGEVAQHVVPSPGPEVSSVTSAGSSHNRLRDYSKPSVVSPNRVVGNRHKCVLNKNWC